MIGVATCRAGAAAAAAAGRKDIDPQAALLFGALAGALRSSALQGVVLGAGNHPVGRYRLLLG